MIYFFTGSVSLFYLKSAIILLTFIRKVGIHRINVQVEPSNKLKMMLLRKRRQDTQAQLANGNFFFKFRVTVNICVLITFNFPFHLSLVKNSGKNSVSLCRFVRNNLGVLICGA